MEQLVKSRNWVLYGVRALNKANSWTGRIHIHKLLFIVKALDLGNPPFNFELYQYGPYSRRLDFLIAEMEDSGELDKTYPAPGYGPKYTLGASIGKTDDDEFEVLGRVANELGNCDSKDLELIATCLWVERIERVESDPLIVDRVAQIKPKYNSATIEVQLRASRKIADALLVA
jgi:uncharacterized protein YwgA